MSGACSTSQSSGLTMALTVTPHSFWPAGYLKTVADEMRLVKLFRMLITWADEFQKATNITWVQQPSGTS